MSRWVPVGLSDAFTAWHVSDTPLSHVERLHRQVREVQLQLEVLPLVTPEARVLLGSSVRACWCSSYALHMLPAYHDRDLPNL
jgi:hypothetical protein